MTKKTPAELLIEEQIKIHGPLPFTQFLDLALYHPTYGYYQRSTPQQGRAGDYFTSHQVADLMPLVFADGLIQMKETLGTEQFTLVELGSGQGAFLETVLGRLEKMGKLKGLQVVAVEKSRPARDRIWRRLSRFPKCSVVPNLEEAPLTMGFDGCVFSNEFFDALPFHRLRRKSKEWTEIHVGFEKNTLMEQEGALSNPFHVELLSLNDLSFLDNQEIEVRPQISEWMKQISQWLNRGYVVTFDYGHPRPFLYNETRPTGTWQCYHQHQTNQEPFKRIGQQDITAHVDFTQLADEGEKVGLVPSLFCSQAIFLSHLGQDTIQRYINEAPVSESQKRKAALKQLIHPDAMGEVFWSFVQRKKADLPPSFQKIPNRLSRLKKRSISM